MEGKNLQFPFLLEIYKYAFIYHVSLVATLNPTSRRIVGILESHWIYYT